LNSSNFDHRKNIHTLFFKDDGVGGGGGGRKKNVEHLVRARLRLHPTYFQESEKTESRGI